MSQTYCGVAFSEGKWPRARTARRMRLSRVGGDGLEGLGDLVPVLAARVAERRPQQMDHMGLDDGLGPGLSDRGGTSWRIVRFVGRLSHCDHISHAKIISL
ncbi:hypothetical protein ABT144_29160 [Streptomyces sp. NPDC002039]|uniref:hypothetical protein n=1 Tax=Streptomyces sp. NPDC002039 TaxID=3154660 RepID=UPI003327CAFE